MLINGNNFSQVSSGYIMYKCTELKADHKLIKAFNPIVVGGKPNAAQ